MDGPAVHCAYGAASVEDEVGVNPLPSQSSEYQAKPCAGMTSYGTGCGGGTGPILDTGPECVVRSKPGRGGVFWTLSGHIEFASTTHTRSLSPDTVS